VNEVIDRLVSINEVSLDLKIVQNLETARTKLVEEILEY
jgi:hypothetical protein